MIVYIFGTILHGAISRRNKFKRTTETEARNSNGFTVCSNLLFQFVRRGRCSFFASMPEVSAWSLCNSDFPASAFCLRNSYGSTERRVKNLLPFFLFLLSRRRCGRICNESDGCRSLAFYSNSLSCSIFRCQALWNTNTIDKFEISIQFSIFSLNTRVRVVTNRISKTVRHRRCNKSDRRFNLRHGIASPSTDTDNFNFQASPLFSVNRQTTLRRWTIVGNSLNNVDRYSVAQNNCQLSFCFSALLESPSVKHPSTTDEEGRSMNHFEDRIEFPSLKSDEQSSMNDSANVWPVQVSCS